jgi:hypothetical protein
MCTYGTNPHKHLPKREKKKRIFFSSMLAVNPFNIMRGRERQSETGYNIIFLTFHNFLLLS